MSERKGEEGKQWWSICFSISINFLHLHASLYTVVVSTGINMISTEDQDLLLFTMSLFSIVFNFLQPHTLLYTVLVSTGKKLTYTEVHYLSMDMISQSSTTVNFILLSVMPEYEDDDGSEEETVVH